MALAAGVLRSRATAARTESRRARRAWRSQHGPHLRVPGTHGPAPADPGTLGNGQRTYPARHLPRESSGAGRQRPARSHGRPGGPAAHRTDRARGHPARADPHSRTPTSRLRAAHQPRPAPAAGVLRSREHRPARSRGRSGGPAAHRTDRTCGYPARAGPHGPARRRHYRRTRTRGRLPRPRCSPVRAAPAGYQSTRGPHSPTPVQAGRHLPDPTARDKISCTVRDLCGLARDTQNRRDTTWQPLQHSQVNRWNFAAGPSRADAISWPSGLDRARSGRGRV